MLRRNVGVLPRNVLQTSAHRVSNDFCSPAASSVSHKGEGEREGVQKVSKLLNDNTEPFQQAPDKQLEIVFIVTIVIERDMIFGLKNSAVIV